MKIEFEISESDYRTFYKQYYSPIVRQHTVSIVVSSVLVGIIVCNFWVSWQSFIIAALAFCFFLLACCYLIPYKLALVRLNRDIASGKFKHGLKSVSITNEGLQIDGSSDVKIIKWTSVTRANNITGFIKLQLVGNHFLIIPKRSFDSDDELVNFLGELNYKVVCAGGAASTSKRAPYLLGILCLIPVVGIFVGIVFIILGITRFKDKWFTLIGVFGVVFTVILYSILFYASRNSKVYEEGFSQISQQELNDLVKSIEFYKMQNGSYPDCLPQLQDGKSMMFINDPIQPNKNGKEVYFNYEKRGERYRLFSSGKDGVPNTADDLYPQLSVSDSSKIGLILKN